MLTKGNREFARVFGVDWFSVISRGSQFKVESFMFRIAKPESLVLLSPSRDDVRSACSPRIVDHTLKFASVQVGRQNAAECMPLIMEPKSDFYNSPLLVLDFQSLYPSIMIAYNYCYSTCLGRVVDFKGQNKLGVTNLARTPGLLGTMENHINGSCMRYPINILLTDVCSCAEWDDIRKTSRSKGVAWKDVKRAPGYEGNGEARHEGGQVRQSTLLFP